MSLDDWILALHVLSAFALVAAMVVFWVILAGRHADPEGARLAPVARIATVGVAVGSLGTLVFGVWLALSVGGYDLWDGWILAALVLWVVGVGTGERGGAALNQGDIAKGTRLQLVSTVAVLLILATYSERVALIVPVWVGCVSVAILRNLPNSQSPVAA